MIRHRGSQGAWAEPKLPRRSPSSHGPRAYAAACGAWAEGPSGPATAHRPLQSGLEGSMRSSGPRGSLRPGTASRRVGPRAMAAWAPPRQLGLRPGPLGSPVSYQLSALGTISEGGGRKPAWSESTHCRGGFPPPPKLIVPNLASGSNLIKHHGVLSNLSLRPG